MSERVVVTREFVAALLAVLSEARNECEASLSPSAQALVPRIAEIEDTAEGVLVDTDRTDQHDDLLGLLRAWATDRYPGDRDEAALLAWCHTHLDKLEDPTEEDL